MTEAKNITESNERLKELDVTLQKIGTTLSALHNRISEISKATEFVENITSSLENAEKSLTGVNNQVIILANTTSIACKELNNFTDIIYELSEAIDELNPKLGDMSSQIKDFEEQSAKSAASNSFGDNLKQQKSTLNDWCQSVADNTSGIKSLMETVNTSFTFGENISKVGSSVVKKVREIRGAFKQLEEGLREGNMKKYYSALEKLPLTSLRRAIGDNFSKVGSSVVKKVGEIRGSFKQLEDGLKEGNMKKYYSALEKLPLTSLKRAASMKAQTIKVKISPYIEKVATNTMAFGKKRIIEPVKSAGKGVGKFFTSPKDYMSSFGDIYAKIQNKYRTIKIKVSPVLEKAVNRTVDFGRKFLVKPVKSAAGGIKKMATSSIDKMPSMGNIYTSAKSLGKNVIVNPAKSAIEGIKRYTSSLREAANAAKSSSGWIGRLSASFSNINVVSRLSALGLGIKAAAVNGLKWATGTALPFLAGLVAQTWAWTSALLANPVVWIVAAILALIAAVVICWNKFAEFRAVIFTAWEVVKGFGGAIWDFLVTPFKVAGEIIQGIMNGISIVLSGGSFMDGVKAIGSGIQSGINVGIKSLTDAGDKAKETVSNIEGNYKTNLAIEEEKDKEKERAKNNPKGAPQGDNLQVAPASPGASEVQPQMVPRESAAVQMTFAPNVTISSELTEKSKSDLMDILQKNASYLASIINEQNRKEKRLNYGVS